MTSDELARLLNVMKSVGHQRAEDSELADPGREQLLKSLLPVLDSLDRLCTANQRIAPESIDAVRVQFEAILAQFGAVPMATQGQEFDPLWHHAAERRHEESVPDRTIVGEQLRGWLWHDQVLRPARVVVSTSDPGASGNDRDAIPSDI